MSKSTIFIVMSILILILAACAPGAVTPAPILTEEPAIPVTGVAVVQSLEIEILESMPVQVNAIIRGQLPDAGCTTITSLDEVRDGNTITITLVTTTDPLALCAQALTPFERVVPLDVSTLPAGQYTVNVHGIAQSFELPGRDAASFQQQLVDALSARDYELLKSLMGDSFMIGYWQSEGTSNTPDQAIEQLQRNLLNGSAPIVADPEKDLAALLGADPVSILGPGVIEASPLFTSGWGPEGRDEVILFVAKNPSGDLYWHGLLFAREGFAQVGPLPIDPIDTDTYATSVRYVMALQDVTIFNGPGSSAAVVGQVYNGQIAKVIGTSIYGDWWRIECPQNASGTCWVSGNPALTEPTTLPHTNEPPYDPESIPSFTVLAVEEDEFVTIQTLNFPANTKFQVRMGKAGTQGIDGVLVEIINSRNGGSFTATFEIPSRLYGEKQISLRLESQDGYYSYNWFNNDSFALAPGDVLPTDVQYVMARQDVSIHSGPAKKHRIIGWLDEGEIVQVTGVSVDGKWWQIACPIYSTGSCWVFARPAYTRPAAGPDL
ncbi:MAG TPA: SH3 domain-containing protein [Anaerolineales bacterium]|nr:SH3 domain-containing protein [Anaerolineales bacterium]